MRKLRRRALRWRRYERRYYDCYLAVHQGAKRALHRLLAEQERRNAYGYGPCYCMGCIADGRCDDDLGRDCEGWDGERQIVDVPDVSTWRLP